MLLHHSTMRHLQLFHHSHSKLSPQKYQVLARYCVNDIEKYGVPELPEVSPDLVLIVKSLYSIQARIGCRGRLHLLLELGESPEENRRTYFYGHSDIVALLSPTVQLENGQRDKHAVQLTSALAGFMLWSSRSTDLMRRPKESAIVTTPLVRLDFLPLLTSTITPSSPHNAQLLLFLAMLHNIPLYHLLCNILGLL